VLQQQRQFMKRYTPFPKKRYDPFEFSDILRDPYSKKEMKKAIRLIEPHYSKWGSEQSADLVKEVYKEEIANLERYGDADVVALTSFKDLKVYTRYTRNKPQVRFESDRRKYAAEFDQLLHILSNADEAKRVRTAYKAKR
jgi:hypothetical protein